MEKQDISNTPLFSIIIPVYNVEKFLKACIDSVLMQKVREYEILLIDDGSTDASGQICDEYAVRDERITVFHQKNQGLGVARNTGILHASGAWIMFLDSDDYWVPDTLEKVWGAINGNNEKRLFVFRYMEDYNGEIRKPPQKGFTPGVDVATDFSKFLVRYELTAGWAVWKLAIHRELVCQNEILTFLEDVRHGEDLYWLIRLFQRAGEITYCDKDIYRYRIRQGSLSGIEPQNCLAWRRSLSNTLEWFCTHEEKENWRDIKEIIALHYMPHVFDSAAIKNRSGWMGQYGEMKKMISYLPRGSVGKRGCILFILVRLPKEVCFWGCIILKKVGQWSQRRVKNL